MSAQPQCPRCGSPRTALDARFCQICGTRLLPANMPSDPLLGKTVLGRYTLQSLLGEGGMGKVYLAEQRLGEGSRRVAVKVLAAARGNDDYIVARFRREAATIAGLSHPNTIRIHDYGEEGGRFISVMEYVPGGSLAELLAREVVTPERAERIAWQVAGALQEAHDAGIVHRDLKPENILLAHTHGVETVKVVDFGIARRPPHPGERPLTISGTMLGTPAFMAPEQFRGEPADARADVYALALVFYQMLTGGRLPWSASSMMDWAEMHLRQEPAALSSQPGVGELSPRYEPALARALAKDPRERTASTLALLRDLTGRDAPPERPPAPARRRVATVEGGPVAPVMPSPPTPATLPSAAPSLPPEAPPQVPLRGSRLGFVAVVALSVAVGFGGVRALQRWRERAPTPTPVTLADASGDASPDASLDASPEAERARARRTLRRGIAAVDALDLRGAVAALAELHAHPVLPPAETDSLRRTLEARGADEVRRLLGAECSKAQEHACLLRTVRVDGTARRRFTRACPAPDCAPLPLRR